jgi:hypothetical protein
MLKAPSIIQLSGICHCYFISRKPYFCSCTRFLSLLQWLAFRVAHNFFKPIDIAKQWQNGEAGVEWSNCIVDILRHSLSQLSWFFPCVPMSRFFQGWGSFFISLMEDAIFLHVFHPFCVAIQRSLAVKCVLFKNHNYSLEFLSKLYYIFIFRWVVSASLYPLYYFARCCHKRSCRPFTRRLDAT